MKLGFFTLITPEFSVRDIIPAAKRWGFDGLEWRISTPGEPRIGEVNYWQGNRCSIDPADVCTVLPGLCAEARAHGIESAAICPYVSCGDLARLEPLMAAAAESGVGVVRVTCEAYDQASDYNEQFTRLRAGFSVVEGLARKHGVRACILQHSGTLLPSASACRRLVDGFDPKHVGILLDVGHFVKEGYEQFGIVVDLLGSYLAEIHLRNGYLVPTGITAGGFPLHEAMWCGIDRGILDLDALGRKLRVTGFDGWLMLEDFSSRPTEMRMTEGIAVMRRMAKGP